MDLNEIEQAADKLLEQMDNTDSAARVRDICFRLDGLSRAAQIKRIVADRKERAAVCGVAHPTRNGVCTKTPGHEGQHGYDDANGRTSAAVPPDTDEEAEPAKHVADRLHELVSYLAQQSDVSLNKAEQVMQDSPPWRKHTAASKAYDDAATKLQEILSEGGI